MKKIIISIMSLLLFVPTVAAAHCPLCTAGAGLAALGAQWLGVGTGPIGVFVGAFGIATGMWISHMIKPRFRYQHEILGVSSFLLTVIPLLSLMEGYWPLYVNMGGDYGTLLNRTYLINSFLVGGIVGGIIVYFSPGLSRKMALLRNNKLIPFQGMIITFGLLFLMSVIMELI